MKVSSFISFLKVPELELPLEQFPFASFSTSKMATEGVVPDLPTDKMLGKQAEYIFEQWLKHSQRFQIIAATIQIQGATETLGELDYIVTDTKTSSTLHIELACKFYLLDETLGNSTTLQWIGPNRKDRLRDKLQKMKTRQFPLLYRQETASVLREFQVVVSNVQQHYCLKAFLFVPKAFRHHELPKYFQNCLAGYYISFNQLKAEADEKALYVLPQKKEWLLPPEKMTRWVSFSEAHKQINNSITEKRSPLIYKKRNGTIEKFFVVWW